MYIILELSHDIILILGVLLYFFDKISCVWGGLGFGVRVSERTHHNRTFLHITLL
jgi:hypothetical protein